MNKIIIALTTGDIDGVGLEVTAKALDLLGPKKNVQFLLFRSSQADKKYLRLIDRKWNRIVVDSTEEALNISGNYILDIDSEKSPAQWVEEAAKLCLKEKISALVTGPLSKTSIKESGLKDIGHTDILKRLSKAPHTHMAFLGKEFNVVLATGHIPLAEVSESMRLKSLAAALWNANSFRRSLPKKVQKRPIGILGLNPHAGELGLIGKEELSFFPKLKAFADQNGIPIEGPLVPDAAFMKKNWNRYSTYLCLYHDQGLIPFKTIHGQDSGVHVTLGIPFVRTSVDHGTAKDIFGKNIANPNSMLEAITWAITLAQK